MARSPTGRSAGKTGSRQEEGNGQDRGCRKQENGFEEKGQQQEKGVLEEEGRKQKEDSLEEEGEQQEDCGQPDTIGLGINRRRRLCRVTSDNIEQAVTALRAGGVIAYPTEAVFGLGCDPNDEAALARIIAIKGREAHKGFILIAASIMQLQPYLAPVEPAWAARFETYWPGPVTLIVPCATGIPSLLSGGRDTVAVRVSDHPLVRRLCNRYGGAIVSTSANRSGEPPCRDTHSVRSTFGEELDAIVDGEVGSLVEPTQIIDLRTGERLR